MKKLYMIPDLSVVEFDLMDVLATSVPVNDPSKNEVPILTRMKDELAGGDGLSELPTEIEEE